MAENSKIEWTHHTFNPWRGCTKVAPGCQHCYADDLSKRNPGTLGIWGPNGTRVVAGDAMWQQPLKWNRTAILTCSDCGATYTTENAPNDVVPVEHPWDFECRCGGNRYTAIRPRVFCASLADVFEQYHRAVVYSAEIDDCGDKIAAPAAWYGPKKVNGKIRKEVLQSGQMLMGHAYGKDYRRATMDDLRKRLFALIDATPNLDWLLLTKRPENIWEMWRENRPVAKSSKLGTSTHYYRPNVWLGTSISDQATADRNIPLLLKCRDLAPVLFVSAEPLLGPVELKDYTSGVSIRSDNGHPLWIDWVIAGGESGHHARPMHPDWVRDLRFRCVEDEIPFLFKQWGEFASVSEVARSGSHFKFDDGATVRRVGKAAAGRMLDGQLWDQYPTTSVETTDAQSEGGE